VLHTDREKQKILPAEKTKFSDNYNNKNIKKSQIGKVELFQETVCVEVLVHLLSNSS